MGENSKEKFEAYFKEMKELKSHIVKIGVPEDTGTYDDGERIIDVAREHEFGTDTTPKRSFINNSMEANETTIKKAIGDGYKKILNGSSNTIQELNILGIMTQDIIKNAFQTKGYGAWRELSQTTVETKGSDDILIDTGKLVQSIKYWVVKE